MELTPVSRRRGGIQTVFIAVIVRAVVTAEAG
jgi:hypothetical protein